MRQSLPRVPKGRIAVLIGVKGATRRELEEAAGCKSIHIDSNTGEIDVIWPLPFLNSCWLCVGNLMEFLRKSMDS